MSRITPIDIPISISLTILLTVVYPRLVCLAYQSLHLNNDAPWCKIDGKDYCFYVEDIASALNLPFASFMDSEFFSPQEYDFPTILRDLTQGSTFEHNVAYAGQLSQSLWLLEHIMKHKMYPYCHDHEERGINLHALYTIYKGEWLSLPYLIEATFRKFLANTHGRISNQLELNVVSSIGQLHSSSLMISKL